MNSNSFSILSKVQNVEVQPNETDASFDGYLSYLWFFIHFKLRPPRERYEFDVLTITARLLLNNEVVISRVAIHSSLTVRGECPYSQWFKFELNPTAIEFIEAHRKGDAQFKIELDFQILMRTLGGIDGAIKNTEGLAVLNTYLQPIIPKSIWAEKILKNLGYHAFMLVEVPVHHSVLLEAYDGILTEFKKAEEYFLKQDYNKTIAHCRSAMDALTRNLIKIKKEEPSESKFEWLKKISEANFEFINKVNRASSEIASKTHHATSSDQDFNRTDAEAIYLVTLGLLHFLSGVKTRSQS